MYLRIHNDQLADYRAFTLLGVSTTRYSSAAGTIGQFGSGSKYSIALLLRKGIKIVVYCGILRMEFFTKPEVIQGKTFNKVFVKYSGKDENGDTKSSTEPLNITTEWGIPDWTETGMAIREFVSNAIDSTLIDGKPLSTIKMDIVDKPRASRTTTGRNETTNVFIEWTEDVPNAFGMVNKLFMHFDRPDWLNKTILPKRFQEKKVYVYKRGVLVKVLDGVSLYDYNLPSLVLDESRNSNEDTCKARIAEVIRDASPEEISPILEKLMKGEECLETKLDRYYLQNESWADDKVQERRKASWQGAFKRIAPPDAVACTESVATINFIQKKGLQPLILRDFVPVLASYGVKTESSVLSQDELDGKQLIEPTEEMQQAVDWVWGFLEKINLTNNKEKPKVKGFIRLEQGNTIIHGYQKGDTVYFESQIGGDYLKKTALHEVAHWVGGGIKDETRDWADLLLRIAHESFKLYERENKTKE